MKSILIPVFTVIVQALCCAPAFSEPMEAVYLLDGIVMSLDSPYYFEGDPEEQAYFTITDYDGNAVDVVVLYEDDFNVYDPLDAMMLFLRRTNIEYYTGIFLSENGEAYALFPDPDRKDLNGYIMFAGSGEEGFFVYGIDIQGSPGGRTKAVMIISYPDYGDELLRDIVEHFHINFEEAAG